jgi:hypothetical protein
MSLSVRSVNIYVWSPLLHCSNGEVVVIRKMIEANRDS